MRLLALFQTAACALALPGQTPAVPSVTETRPVRLETVWEEQLRSLPKRFPPELPSMTGGASPTMKSPAYCVYPTLGTKSLSIERCRQKHQFRLIAPFKTLAPKTKPTE